MSPSDDSTLLAAARALTTALAEQGFEPTFIGGVAVSLVARPRFTKDLDALIVFDTAHCDELLQVLERHDFTPRFANMAETARRSRVVLLTHGRTGTAVDLALGCMPFESEVLERADSYRTQGGVIRLATPEDLVIMKAVAGRPRDREDIRAIGQLHPDLDRKRVKYWVEQYGEVLDNPGLWDDVESLLNSKPG